MQQSEKTHFKTPENMNSRNEYAGFRDKAALMIYIYVLFLLYIFVREFLWI